MAILENAHSRVGHDRVVRSRFVAGWRAVVGLGPINDLPRLREHASALGSKCLTLIQKVTVLGAELHILPTYIVKQKGIYQTDDLIEHAERAFDEATLNGYGCGAADRRHS